MTLSRLTLSGFVLAVWTGLAVAQQPTPSQDKLPLTGLPPAKQIDKLCLLKYRVSTSSSDCQALFDQGLGYFYSYVWMEAARSFETAARHDPDCALAWWGLSRALERWAGADPNKATGQEKEKRHLEALNLAKEKMPLASHREQLLIKARLQEKGLLDKLTGEARWTAAAKTLDELIALYDDDQEGWAYRANVACRGRTFGGTVESAPFYKALVKVNPLHPGANHELLHFYEGMRRPALGWPHAEKYIESSPGIPHAFHMQAHLATRLGRWDKTSDRSARAIELQRAYHKEMNVKPGDDLQFAHHAQVLMLSLVHDGRFREARALKEEVRACGFDQWESWFRLHLADRDWNEALKCIDAVRRGNKLTASYLAALLYLKQGNIARATPEIEVLQQAYQTGKRNAQLEFRLWEVQGLCMCQTGAPEGGLKLLTRAVERSKDDYSHHAWGNGAYYMEEWGVAALQNGKDDVAEEAFQEALAHDAGSVRAALGMQVLCERHGRTEEAARYGELAQRCWRRADAQAWTMLKEEVNTRAGK